jgi:hypothetical protein
MVSVDQITNIQPIGDKDGDKDHIRLNYYSNLTYLECQGDKCRMHAYQMTGYHCLSCYDMLTEDEWKPLSSYNVEVVDGPSVVNCYGNRCRLNNSVIYCESCNGIRLDENGYAYGF